MRRPPPALILAAALLAAAGPLAGCLPSSQKTNTRAMSAADSASVALAQTVTPDTLALAWTADLTGRAPYPTGLAWVRPDSADARLAVVDTQDGRVLVYSAAGDSLAAVELPDGPGRFPYLAGVRGDTVLVLSRGRGTVDRVVLGAAGPPALARSLAVPDGATAAAPTARGLVLRVGGGATEAAPALVRLDARGREAARYPLAGGWRASGFVRAWGDTLLALSGYRPVADVLAPASAPGATLDTLAFRGFDSPQLVRSHQFRLGEIDEPPLLTSSAAALGDTLYVLNLRADHVRVDLYGRAGRLRGALVSPRPWAIQESYATDLAVRRTAGGAVEIAVLMQRPSGFLQRAAARVDLFRWSSPAL